MPTKRTSRLVKNGTALYQPILSPRGKRSIFHYATPDISYPTKEQISKMQIIQHVWKQGDKFYKLAFNYYGDAELWWLIPWFNKKPLESAYMYGEIVFVPLDFDEAFKFF